MKIHIIGGSGSGKSHLAETLSAKYGMPHYDLDELQWDSSGAYGQKRAPEERRRLLDEILENQIGSSKGYITAGASAALKKRT